MKIIETKTFRKLAGSWQDDIDTLVSKREPNCLFGENPVDSMYDIKNKWKRNNKKKHRRKLRRLMPKE